MNSFAAVNAKVDHMYGQFLSDGQLLALAKMNGYKASLDASNKLGIYGPFDLNGDIYQLEWALNGIQLEKERKLQYFLQGPYKRFLKTYALSHKYEEIKLVLRALRAGKGIESLPMKELALDHKTIPLKNESIAQFVDRLKGTRYYESLRAYQNEDQEVILFYMEMNLDKFYYQDLLREVRDFSKEDRAWFKDTFGRKIDLYNLLWITRAKKYYQLLPEELVNFCILGGAHLDFKKLQDLAYSKSLEDLERKVGQTPYGFIFQGENIYLLSNRRMHRYLYYYTKGRIKEASNCFGKVLCYLILLETELNDFRILFEGARFGLAYQDKLKYLARHIEGSEA